MDELDTGYTGTREQKLWIAAHRISGYRVKATANGSTRPASGIGHSPDKNNPSLMTIVRTSVGAGFLAKMTIPLYLELAGKPQTTEDELIEQHVDDERAPLTYWALKRIHEHCRGRARFWNGDHFVYNDTFYIKMRSCSHIVIGSDSRAGYHGGWGRNGPLITIDERPRFRTHYEYPYFRYIQKNLGATPGARR